MQMVDFSTLAHAFPVLPLTADLKAEPEDFCVTEQLGFTPSGEGEHVFLFIRKRQLTTELLARDLARLLAIPQRDVAYSGLKDKQAVTEQWFSVPWPIKKPFPELQGMSWQVLEATRHHKKLRRGVHHGNAFDLCLTNLQGDITLLEQRLQQIQQTGFPNYFGEQRFGNNGSNVERALALFAGQFRCKPFQRSMYYSAARSYLFNAFLSQRVQQGNWNQPLEGDRFSLDGSNALFGPEPLTDAIYQRVQVQDIHPAGPLPGKGNSGLQAEAARLYEQVLQDYPELSTGLQQAGVETAFRPLRACAKSLNWQLDQQQCRLRFELRSGAFATALIRELVNINHAAHT